MEEISEQEQEKREARKALRDGRKEMRLDEVTSRAEDVHYIQIDRDEYKTEKNYQSALAEAEEQLRRAVYVAKNYKSYAHYKEVVSAIEKGKKQAEERYATSPHVKGSL